MKRGNTEEHREIPRYLRRSYCLEPSWRRNQSLTSDMTLAIALAYDVALGGLSLGRAWGMFAMASILMPKSLLS